MKVIWLTLAVFMIIVLLPPTATLAQQSTTPEEVLIKQYREEIRSLSSKQPPPEAEEAQRKALLLLRSRLRDLLLMKKGALAKDVRDLKASTSLPESQAYLKELEKVLQSVEAELQTLNPYPEQLVDSAPVEPFAHEPARDAIPTGRTQPSAETGEQAAKREAFERAVSKFSDEAIVAAAAPTEVSANKLPEPICNETGRPVNLKASKYDEFVCRLASDVSKARVRRIRLSRDQAPLLSILIAKLLKTTGDESYVSLVTEAQEERLDQQMGSGPASSGTTSLVVKGGVPYLLGFAVENGAAVQSRSDTTVTFRFNPAGVIKLFENKGFITGFRETQQDPAMNFFRKTSVGLSFDTSRGSQAGTFTGDKQQLSAVSARFEFVNERDPRHKKYEKKWEEFMADKGLKLAEQIWQTTIELQKDFGTRTGDIAFKDPALQAWLEQTNGELTKLDASLTGLEAINSIASFINQRAARIPVKLVSEETVKSITDFAKGFEEYEREREGILDTIAKGKVLTLEYTNKREVNAPDTSNFNFIAATGTGARVSLTANGSLTLFNKRPLVIPATSARANRIRDFQFAGEIAIPFKVGDGRFDFWFSGRYERLLTDALTVAGTTLPGTRGDIAIGQFGLNIPIPGLGMKFPVSFTFANRTELVKEKEIRGNFGFTFNWDTLFSKIKPF